MSDQNPSDSFDSHPDNSGCSNDDFEQVDSPSSGFYYHDNHNNGDADGPDAVGPGPGAYYDDYDPEQAAEVSTTTANLGEDEAEEDLYAAGASEADEAYSTHTSDHLSLGEVREIEDNSFDAHSVQPSAPDLDFEPAIGMPNYTGQTGEEILAAIAPLATPPSSHYDYAEHISSTIKKIEDNDYEFNDSKKGKERRSVSFPDKDPAFYDLRVSTPTSRSGSSSPASSSHSRIERRATQFERTTHETKKGKIRECSLMCIDPRVKDLIYWRDVKKTGVIFGSILVVLLSLAIFSVLSVVAYLSLAVLTVTFSFVFYKKMLRVVQKTTSDHPFKSLLDKDISLNEDMLKDVIQTGLKNVNATLKELRHLFLVEDVVDSVKFGLLLWALTYIGSWFSDLSLIVIAFILVFTVPKSYETYQVQIDNYIGLAKAQINRYLCIIQSKVPFLNKKEKAN